MRMSLLLVMRFSNALPSLMVKVTSKVPTSDVAEPEPEPLPDLEEEPMVPEKPEATEAEEDL